MTIYLCPPAIVAARAGAKNFRPQPLPAKILAIGVLGMAANVQLGIWREHTKKFSPSWFLAVHAAVPFICMLRKSVLMPKTAMAFTIASSILGSRAEQYCLKAISARPQTVVLETFVGEFDPIGVNVGVSHMAGVMGGHCGEAVEWNSSPLQVTWPSPRSEEFARSRYVLEHMDGKQIPCWHSSVRCSNCRKPTSKEVAITPVTPAKPSTTKRQLLRLLGESFTKHPKLMHLNKLVTIM